MSVCEFLQEGTVDGGCVETADFEGTETNWNEWDFHKMMMLMTNKIKQRKTTWSSAKWRVLQCRVTPLSNSQRSSSFRIRNTLQKKKENSSFHWIDWKNWIEKWGCSFVSTLRRFGIRFVVSSGDGSVDSGGFSMKRICSKFEEKDTRRSLVLLRFL